MSRFYFGVILFIYSLCAYSSESAGLKMEAKAVIQGFAKDLQSELLKAVKTGGPVSGIEACNVKAPYLEDLHSQSSWQVSRTSLKYRNPSNQPDLWEKEQLERFNEESLKGQDPMTMWAVYEDEKQVRVMKAIPTKGVCLTCHGMNLAPKVRAKLDELYPSDLATDYELGQIRGAFSLIRTKE